MESDRPFLLFERLACINIPAGWHSSWHLRPHLKLIISIIIFLAARAETKINFLLPFFSLFFSGGSYFAARRSLPSLEKILLTCYFCESERSRFLFPERFSLIFEWLSSTWWKLFYAQASILLLNFLHAKGSTKHAWAPSQQRCGCGIIHFSSSQFWMPCGKSSMQNMMEAKK